MNTFSYRQKINPGRDLKLLSQDWVFVKKQQKTEFHSQNNSLGISQKTDHPVSIHQNSFSELRFQERSTVIPFLNGQQTFYTGIRDYSNENIKSQRNGQNQSIENFNLTQIMSLSLNKQNRSGVNNNSIISQGTGGFNSIQLKSPYKRTIKSSRESTDKCSVINSINKFQMKDNKPKKILKKLNQTVDIGQIDSNYDSMDFANNMLSSMHFIPQQTSDSTAQGYSTDKKNQRRSSLFKNSKRKSKLNNNLSASFILTSNVSHDSKQQARNTQKTKDHCEKEQNEIQKWTEQTAIFVNEKQTLENEKLPQTTMEKSEVQAIIDGLFQEIEERDKDKSLELEIMEKYKKQKNERLAKSQQDAKIQRINNTNIVLSYSRGKDIQSNANGFQMSKYLYNQKYGHYKCIPQSYNTELIPTQDQLIAQQLNKPDYTVQELKDIPFKSIYNPEIDESKKYLSAVRISEREQYQLKVPASKLMREVLKKYDKDKNFVVQNVEQQDNQNIIQEVYGDFLQNPAKRLNISKIKENQLIQNNLYDSRYVKPFVIEEENTSEGNRYTNNSHNTEVLSPRKKEISNFAKAAKQQESQRSQSPPESNQQCQNIPRIVSGLNSPITQRNRNNITNYNTSNNSYNFSNFVQPQKSIFSPQSSIQVQQSPEGRITPLRFKRNPFDVSIQSPQAPLSRPLPKKKKIQVKTNINEVGKINEARISSPFVKVSDCERGMKQNASTDRQKFYDSWYSPPNLRQQNLDRHLQKYINNEQYQKKLVQQYILLKSNGNTDPIQQTQPKKSLNQPIKN
ncbi:hypothetical protein TTHERM_00483710 (macronuclear) [Tetrahymena thermophila SB210]|uniref:Uncharacterized protein n=1 Tax=Tetrahymena thermophila (strain SB210) TaxID=312017 RepID=I7M862_TETTS|nr:hypothetical protein TTHERM_00483710 [Tetrahymena thermophila SB210]EAR97238.1 hypothetical protein TTHERM_00483710 [Tetrahymena thermophila SB210]|eukprot:XP_001017483.1 hypothetical protein TTHERM_00483710 [Tetrahymena thermophila SB210]